MRIRQYSPDETGFASPKEPRKQIYLSLSFFFVRLHITNLKLSFLIIKPHIINKINMIKGQYQVLDLLKDNNFKRVERVVKGETVFIAKSYAKQEGKLAQNQIKVYQNLKQPQLNGIPEFKDVFEDGGRAYIIMQECGEDIDALRNRCGGRLGLKTVLMVGVKILERIQYLHRCEILHGDIKPSNFLVGKGKLKHKIYLTDFQLSHSYMKGGKHISEDVKQKFSGSLRFSSRAANSKTTIGRKDDLESWLYSLIFLLNGQLPWMQIASKNMVGANQQLLKLKTQQKSILLSGLPPTFTQIHSYLSDLKFPSAPDYQKLKDLLCSLMSKNGYQTDYKYDWQYL